MKGTRPSSIHLVIYFIVLILFVFIEVEGPLPDLGPGRVRGSDGNQTGSTPDLDTRHHALQHVSTASSLRHQIGIEIAATSLSLPVCVRACVHRRVATICTYNLDVYSEEIGVV